MKKNNILLFVILGITISILSSCFLPNKNENSTYIDDYKNAEEIDVDYSSEANEVYFEELEDGNEYIVSVNGTFDPDELYVFGNYVSYNYEHNESVFSVSVKVYNEKKRLIAYSEKEFKPLKLDDISFDKENKVLSFYSADADGYIVRRGYAPEETIYDNEIVIDELEHQESIDVTIKPFSNDTDYYEIITSKNISRCENITGLRYSDVEKLIKWDSPVYSSLVENYFILKINDDVYEVPGDERTFKYDINEPTRLELTFVSYNQFRSNSETLTREIIQDEKQLQACVADGSFQWESLGSGYKYDCSITVNGEEVYNEITEKNVISISDYEGEDIKIKVLPYHESKTNVYFVMKEYDYHIFKSPVITQSYDEFSRTNTMKIRCEDENILGYDINIIYNEESYDYSYDGAEIVFTDFQFEKSGRYSFNVAPRYKQLENVEGASRYKVYTKTISRLEGFSKLSNYYNLYSYQFDLYSDQGLMVIIDDSEIRTQLLNRFSCSYTNSSTHDVVKNYKFFKYNTSKYTTNIVLPSYDYQEVTIKYLGKIYDVKLEGDTLTWDYENDSIGFEVRYKNNRIETMEKTHKIDFSIADEIKIYIVPLGNDDELICNGTTSLITVYKHKNPVVSKVITDYKDIVFEFENAENSSKIEVITQNNVYTTSESTITIPYNEVYKEIKIKMYGSGFYYDSDYSTYTISKIDTSYFVASINNYSKTISWTGLDSNAYISKKIIKEDEENVVLYEDEINEKSIDISSYGYGYYQLLIESRTVVENDVIYVGKIITEYDFTIVDFEIIEEKYGYRAKYYPEGIEEYYRKMKLDLEADALSYVSSYETSFVDYCVPDLKSAFTKDVTVDLIFTYSYGLDSLASDRYVPLKSTYKIRKFLEVTNPDYGENKVNLRWDEEKQDLEIKITDKINSNLTYTITGEQVVRVDGDDPIYTTKVTKDKVTYSVMIEQQTIGDYIYLPYEFELYYFKSYSTTEPITITKLAPIEGLHIGYTTSTSGSSKMFSLTSVSFTNPNYVNNIYHRITKCKYNPITGEYTNKEVVYEVTLYLPHGYQDLHENSLARCSFNDGDTIIVEFYMDATGPYIKSESVTKIYHF